jgi:uncharacterized repeat protein (TIGR03847 family)
MSRIVYRHKSANRFIVSAIGQPGEREFFLQIKSAEGVNTIALEKEQVRALSDQLQNLLTEIRRSGMIDKSEALVQAQIDNDPLELPIESDFELGIANIAWRDKSIEITFQAISGDDVLILDDLDNGPDLIVANISIEIAKGFCIRANELIKSGRADCPFCGLPINISGHLCPRANGYRR